VNERRTEPFVEGDLAPNEPTGAMPAAGSSVGTQPFVRDVATSTHAVPKELAPSQPTEGIEAVDVVAGFRIGRKLGEGGMATVFEAVHMESGQRVALKRVKEAGRGDKQFTDRFLREVQAASGLDHEHICKVLGGGRAENDRGGEELYMAVELIEGGDLDKLLRNMGGALPAAAATVVICELLEALDHAHGKGVVHRDIKPANVMLAADGTVKLVDFGIARAVGDQKLTATGLVVGTPSYMSPEQARGMETDGRSDLFSVGVMLIELVTGSNPFFAESATATVMKILLEQAPPLFALDPSAPGVLHHVVAGLLERDRARRYPSARAALDDLAPYRALVMAQHPRLLRECLERPEHTKRLLLAEQAQFERDRAADLLELGEVGLPAATLALVRALKLEPDNADARRMLDDVVQRASFDLRPSDERIRALEEGELAKPNAAAASWRRAADLHRAARNPPGQARALSYYLQRQPSDELATRQFRAIASGPEVDAKQKKSTRVALSTREIVDGIRTGGFKAASSTEQFTTVRPVSGPGGATGASASNAADALFGDGGFEGNAARATMTGATPMMPRGPGARPARASVRTDERIAAMGGARERSGASGTWMMAGGLAVVVALVFTVFSWSAKETAKGTEQVVLAAQNAVNVEDRTREQSQRLLDQAREALAQRADNDALMYADQAMSLNPGMTERADALFIKARARMISGDEGAAHGDLRRYFDEAPPSHRDMHEARALDAKLSGARAAPPGMPALPGGAP
jgi:hypothetical protein